VAVVLWFYALPSGSTYLVVLYGLVLVVSAVTVWALVSNLPRLAQTLLGATVLLALPTVAIWVAVLAFIALAILVAPPEHAKQRDNHAACSPSWPVCGGITHTGTTTSSGTPWAGSGGTAGPLRTVAPGVVMVCPLRRRRQVRQCRTVVVRTLCIRGTSRLRDCAGAANGGVGAGSARAWPWWSPCS